MKNMIKGNEDKDTAAQSDERAAIAVSDGGGLPKQPTRHEHMQWCKRRALECVDMGDLDGAYASMASDLGKHDETRGHIAISLGMSLMMAGLLSTPEQMRKFINDFN